MTEPAVIPAATNHPIVVLRGRLEARKDELKHALPSDISPDVFIRALMTSVQINPELLACSFSSMWTACMKACRDGLLPDGVEGAIVPYKDKATWIPMVQGVLRKFRRSGQFKWVTAGIVREGERFEHYIDESGEHFKHVPGDSFTASISKIYALAITLEGGVFAAVLPIAEANKIRNMSRTKRDDAPWQQWPEEMYKKTALKRLSKMLPSVRDLIPPEEDESDEEPAPAQLIPRPPGAAAALDQFAGTEPTNEQEHHDDDDGKAQGPSDRGDAAS